MKSSFTLIALAAISSTTSATLSSSFGGSSDLFVRSLNDDNYYSSLISRDAFGYDDDEVFLIQQTRRSLAARFEHADSLSEAHLLAREEANDLYTRAAISFPEIFARSGFKVPSTPEACRAKRAEVTAEYHSAADSYGTKKMAYPKDGDYAKAKELFDLASKVVVGRNRAKKLIEAEGCTADSAHANEINTWENNKTQWSNEMKKQKNKKS